MNTDELRRLKSGPLADERAPSPGLERFIAHCAGNAPVVLDRCKQVMKIVLEEDVDRWPTDKEWKSLLPDWFVTACAEDDPFEEEGPRGAAPGSWTVGGWVYWFLPEERQWFWWDASVLNVDTIEILIQVSGDPYPWGALDWLLKASGAIRMERTW